MSRRNNLSRIKRMLDRALASPHEPDASLRLHAAAVIDEWINCPERFEIERGWSTANIYELAMTFARLAPPNVLAKMARRADQEYAWCERWDAEGWYESNDFVPLNPRSERAA